MFPVHAILTTASYKSQAAILMNCTVLIFSVTSAIAVFVIMRIALLRGL